MIGSYVFGAFSLVFCILFCIFRASKATVYSLCLKTIASVCFIMSGIFAIKFVGESSVSLLIVAGLVMGLIGDIILDLKIMYPDQGNQYFVAGTTSFVIGHFFYFVAVLLYNSTILPTHLLWNILAALGFAIIMTTATMLVSKKMGLNFGKMIYLVIFYCLVLTFMTGFAVSIAIFNPIFWIFAAGMILFLASDLVLSMQYFGNATGKVFIYINHILYYLAQILIAISLLFVVI